MSDVTPQAEPQGNTIYSPDMRDDFNIDDLIPEELRAAVSKVDEPEVTEPTTPEPVATPTPEPVAAFSKPEELDLSPEAIDSLIAGDVSAVTKKEAAEALPFWKEDESYKNISQRLTKLGMKSSDVDEFIQRVTDKSTVDNTKLVSGLEERTLEAERNANQYKAEIDRLRVIERATYFDTSDEVRDTYGTPMTQSAKEIQNVLKREGVNVPVEKLLLAKNKTDMVSLLEEYKIEDADMARITNHWRNYKELDNSYRAAKEEAQRGLRNGLSTKISPETVHSILRSSLSDFVKADTKYSYINTAIQEGLDKHPDVSNLIGVAKNNFQNIVQAISAPTEALHNTKYMQNLAKYTFDAAHNMLIEKKFNDLKSEHTKALTSLGKLVSEYKKLANSAKGITGGSNGLGVVGKNKGKSVDARQKEIVAEFEELLKNEKKIDDLIP